MAGTFSAQIAAAVAEIKGGVEAVVKQSAQDVLEEASRPVAQGGNLPVDLGFLRNSLSVALNAEPTGPSAKPDGYSNTGAPAVELAIAGFEMGDTISARWTAEYAPHVEYGARGRPGRAFVRQAAQKWASFVAANAARLLNGR